jgi:hypothetical protein
MSCAAVVKHGCWTFAPWTKLFASTNRCGRPPILPNGSITVALFSGSDFWLNGPLLHLLNSENVINSKLSSCRLCTICASSTYTTSIFCTSETKSTSWSLNKYNQDHLLQNYFNSGQSQETHKSILPDDFLSNNLKSLCTQALKKQKSNLISICKQNQSQRTSLLLLSF